MLSPVEIRKQEFSHSLRGYDREEVRAFLESVASEMEKLVEQTRVQSGEIERLQSELSSYRRMEETMREALVNAQEALRDAREGAQREAQLIHREAELVAEKIISEARKKADELHRQIEDLNMRKQILARRLKQILSSELELLNLLTSETEEEDRPLRTNEGKVDPPSALKKNE